MERVDKVNKNKTYVGWLSEEELHRKELKTERYLGEKKAKIEAAKKMLAKDIDIKIIEECTGLSIEEIEKL